MLQRKILSLSNLSLFESESIFSWKIISERKNIVMDLCPATFKSIVVQWSAKIASCWPCSWDMAHDIWNCYFSFRTIFCPFTPITARKMKISQKWKKHLEISSFYTSAPKLMIIVYVYCPWATVHDKCNCCFSLIGHFSPFNPLPPPNDSKNQNLKKKKKKMPEDIIILHKCTKTHDQSLYCP